MCCRITRRRSRIAFTHGPCQRLRRPPLRCGPAGDTARPLRLGWLLRPAGFPGRPVYAGPARTSHLTGRRDRGGACQIARFQVGRGGATPAHVQKMAPARTLARLREQERRRCARFKLPQPFDSPAPGPDRPELEHAGCKDPAAGCCRSSSRPAGSPPSWPAPAARSCPAGKDHVHDPAILFLRPSRRRRRVRGVLASASQLRRDETSARLGRAAR